MKILILRCSSSAKWRTSLMTRRTAGSVLTPVFPVSTWKRKMRRNRGQRILIQKAVNWLHPVSSRAPSTINLVRSLTKPQSSWEHRNSPPISSSFNRDLSSIWCIMQSAGSADPSQRTWSTRESSTIYVSTRKSRVVCCARSTKTRVNTAKRPCFWRSVGTLKQR